MFKYDYRCSCERPLLLERVRSIEPDKAGWCVIEFSCECSPGVKCRMAYPMRTFLLAGLVGEMVQIPWVNQIRFTDAINESLTEFWRQTVDTLDSVNDLLDWFKLIKSDFNPEPGVG